jgi:hypothetical protein
MKLLGRVTGLLAVNALVATELLLAARSPVVWGRLVVGQP